MLYITIGAMLTCSELINLVRQTGNKVFKTLLGYAWILEITASLILPAFAVATGSVTALMMSVIGGTMFTLTLEVCKRVVGTRKYKKVVLANGKTKRQWVETEGVSFAEFCRGFAFSAFHKVKSFGKALFAKKEA